MSRKGWLWVGKFGRDGFLYGDKELLILGRGNLTYIYPDFKSGIQVVFLETLNVINFKKN